MQKNKPVIVGKDTPVRIRQVCFCGHTACQYDFMTRNLEMVV